MLDMIVIGAGTAGLTAALYGRRAGLQVLVLESGFYGGQIANTPEVENYPAIPRISGVDFSQALYDQVAALGADGESVITGLEHISRGYESMERDLSQLGAHIRRVEESRMPDRTLNNT